MNCTLFATVDRFSDRWLCDSVRHDADEFCRAKRLAIFNLVFLFWSVGFAGGYVALGSVWCGAVTLLTALPIATSALFLKRGRSPSFCANVGIAGMLTLTGLAALNGGLEGPSLLWYTVLPVVAVLASGAISGVIWTAICSACLVGFAIAEACGVVFPQELGPSSLALFTLTVVIGLVVCQFVLAYVRIVIEDHASAALHEAKSELAETRRKFSRLEQSRGYSIEQMWTLQKERAALIRFIRFKYGEFDLQFEESDNELDDEFLIDEEPDEVNDSEDEPDLATLAIQTILAGSRPGVILIADQMPGR